jgi:hypothetical protein
VSSVLVSPSRVGSSRFSSPLAIALGLLLPVLAVPALGRAYADHLADGIALDLLATFAPMGDAYATIAGDQPRDEEAILSETPALQAAVHQEQSEHRTAAHVYRAPAVHGVRISAAQVLALAERRAMPQAVPVKANAYHPAGLLLRGVSALGVGVQDGDVLTEAAGQKATTVATVIGIVLAARARQSPEISGRFYRAGVQFLVTVEQPYPKNANPG